MFVIMVPGLIVVDEKVDETPRRSAQRRRATIDSNRTFLGTVRKPPTPC